MKGVTMSRRSARNQKYNAAVAEYRKLAKRADQRLVRLEKYSKRQKYSNVKEFAYARAMRDIRSWSGKDASRFNTKPPSNLNSLMAKINDIKNFLQSASSTIKPTADNAVYNQKGELIGGGIDLTYQKRAMTLNTKYGTDLSWENVGELFESALYRKLAKKYDSKTSVQIIGQLQSNEKNVVKSFKAKKPISVHVDFTDSSGKKQADEILEEKVNKTLIYYKKDINSLFDSL